MKYLSIVLFCGILCSAVGYNARFAARHHTGHHSGHQFEAIESDNIAQKEQWEYLRLRDPATGNIPRGMHARELEFARTIGTSAQALKAQSATVLTNGWRSAGPINAGGRTLAIGVDAANEANVLIATAQGGMFRSTDSGETWRRTSAPGELKDMTCIVQDQRAGKTHIWYAGTGELQSTTWRRAALNVGVNVRTQDIGDGIYKSTDSGQSWTVLPATHDVTETVLDSTFDIVWNVAVDNSRPSTDIVYAAAYGAIMRSTDGGGSWTQVLGDVANLSTATDIAITSKGVLYAYLSSETADGAASSAAGIWRSTDGLHWANITPDAWPANTFRMKFAIAPSDETIFYISGLAPDVGYTPVLWQYHYHSGDGSGSGGSWDDRSAHVPHTDAAISAAGVNTYVGYALTLRVFPTDPNIVVIGGTNLFRSFDGFTSEDWDWIGGYGPDQFDSYLYPNHHPDNHDLVFAPTNPRRAYSANDGGIFVTNDILAHDLEKYPVTWQDVNDHDIASIIYDVALDHSVSKDSAILGGFQDQGLWYGAEGSAWGQIPDGDGCYCAIAERGRLLYISSQNANIEQYDTLTQQWTTISPAGGVPEAQFVAPWMLDPTDEGTMFIAGGGQLFRNNSLAQGGGSCDVLPGCTAPGTAVISALGMSVLPSHRLYYGTSDGHLYRLDDSGDPSPVPQDITSPLFPRNAFISCVSVDPQNADSIIACFSNYRVQSLFASSDGGSSWRNISGDLEQYPDGSGDGPSTRWVSVVHQAGQTLFLCGTSVGLFSTTTLSGTVDWQPEGLNTIGRSIVENIDVRQSDGYVAIATQGSGVFVTNVVTSISAVTPGGGLPAAGISIVPNPASTHCSISLTSPGSGHFRLTLLDLSGCQMATLVDGVPASGTTAYAFDCSRLPTGSYYVEYRSGDAVETRRLVVQR